MSGGGNHGRGSPRSSTAAAPALVLLAAVLLSGCNALGGITGAVAGAASGTASGNPGVGIAVAIGVKTAIDAAQKRFDRYWHAEEQRSIATQIGALEVGEEAPWQVRHVVPYQDSQGRVRVLRAFSSALAECKEALFTVEDEEPEEGIEPAETRPVDAKPAEVKPARQQYLTTACRGEQGWRWASAEPAVARWGTLH